MPASDHGFKIIARNGAAGLARIAKLDVGPLEPVESTIQTTTERLADRVFRAGRGQARCLVYMEFVTTWDQRVLWPLLSKTGLLAEAERLPVETLVFILRPKGYRSQNGTFRLEINGRVVQQIWFHEVPLWETVPEPWWDQVPALMGIYPLCAHGQSPQKAVGHAARVIDEQVKDPPRRSDFLTTLNVFGEMAYPGLNVTNLIGRAEMEESPFYQRLLHEGRVEQAHKDLRGILEERFGSLPGPLVTRLEAIPDEKRLHELVLSAVRSPSLDEFQAGLGKAPRRRKAT